MSYTLNTKPSAPRSRTQPQQWRDKNVAVLLSPVILSAVVVFQPSPESDDDDDDGEKKSSFRIRPNYGPLPRRKNPPKRPDSVTEGGKSTSEGTGERVSRPHVTRTHVHDAHGLPKKECHTRTTHSHSGGGALLLD